MKNAIFERQGYQIVFTIVATLAVLFLGRNLSADPKLWLQLGLLIAIVHQTYVWFIWRLQLQSQWISKRFGEKGFDFYVVGFFLLFVSRLVATIILAYYDRHSIHIPTVLWWYLTASISVLSAYTFYSVARYFGMKRATGADHFFERYRKMPFVKQGMFQFSSNAMYLYGTLLILLPGIMGESYFAILLGIFNYLYVWVHYFCLEKPDIRRIYGK